MPTWSDDQLAEALQTAQAIERQARAALETPDVAERDATVIVVRHVTALRRSLESWIGTRAIRARVHASSS